MSYPATRRGSGAPRSWTQLTAVYDALHGTASLYVNGKLAGSQPVTTTPWSATGSFAVGRDLWNDNSADWFTGDVDAVQAYQGVLTYEDVAALAAG